ncbi:LacI family DNA-binding transcriptional regulator [Serratia odorifera]|jgi:DNA-binding LacI/PurR family transcriptional regulator|uniref:Sugar-binding domain protein n=1 Tax=Serratia odorifera DSM 4582 TaxID=667129 RepID=D4DZK9_SEROD|nr:LacI family DNA-binding transcriptional regulator [Serratia odorifera]EFE96980.1 sugar-binding domain protein [Serratia odorifera DSM 4582]MBJ2067853.1 LacI family DNA-binding transcriptional regulator [Serratia odorifera]PNK91529.1 LacI family DNA-binding transcriptional regulator [Serratia odorifera]RII72382.1 LacI family DNA-binding transcriptional regulator [Serratia odorifera]
MSDAKNHWVTASDVARLAGVSRSAVSRTFTPGASVSEKTRQRVEAAAAELGYQVNIIARSMITGSSNFIGLVTAGFDNPFRSKLLAPLVHHLALQGFMPLLLNADDPKQLAPRLRELLSYHVAGVILTSGAPPLSLAEEYLARKIPVTLINRQVELSGADQVCSDNHQGARLAARQLMQHRVTCPGFIGESASFSSLQRQQAFESQFDAQRQPMARVICPHGGYQAGWDAAAALLAQQPHLDGLFCATDMLAMGAMDFMRQQRPGQQLPLVGFDDIPQSAFAPYQLTTLRQDTDALASTAVALLVSRIRHFDQPAVRKSVPVELIVRQSA